jgi:peptide subunit release factor 1 (eRF1)
MQELLSRLQGVVAPSGTSMISLSIPGSEDLVRVMGFLTAEIATARNIKSRV